jgi:tetratricopeptide (TPR) repeat protein
MRLRQRVISKSGLWVLLLALPTSLSAGAAQYVAWGDGMLAQKKYAAALPYYSAAVKADPTDAAAYRGLGYAEMGAHNDTQGLKYMEYSLHLNPDDSGLSKYLAGIYQGYGNRYHKMGDQDHALGCWRKALALDPGNTALAAYVASINGASAAPAPSANTATAAALNATSGPSAPAPLSATASAAGPSSGINPWIMVGTVAGLGAIMIFLF